jgi:processive 1,2-diacylglycerol beta-glucosyltransferase
MNLLAKHIFPKLLKIRRKQFEKIMSRHLEKEDPDLLISIIPFVNYPASEAARKKEIPYLIITTDHNLENWVVGLQQLSHPKFKVTISGDHPTTKQMLLDKGISPSQIEEIGLPLRPDFIKKRNVEHLQQLYNIPKGKSNILLMMGGAGSETAYTYAEQILKMDLSTHLIVCAGKNHDLISRLNSITPHASNSLTALSFTENIADLMAISDLIITKPGPGTINEAIAMNLPMLIDDSSNPLYWERANIELVLNRGIGHRITDSFQAKEFLERHLKDIGLKERVKQAFAKIPRNLFHEQIEKIIDEMIAK